VLDYIIFAALFFYMLTILGLFVLRFKRPDAVRLTRRWLSGAAGALKYRAGGLDLYRIIAIQARTLAGHVLVLARHPVFLFWSRRLAVKRNMSPIN